MRESESRSAAIAAFLVQFDNYIAARQGLGSASEGSEEERIGIKNCADQWRWLVDARDNIWSDAPPPKGDAGTCGKVQDTMTFEQAAERLRKLDVTCGVMVYEDGYQAELSNGVHNFYASPTCDTLEEAAKYLHAAAKRLYPDTYGKEEA